MVVRNARQTKWIEMENCSFIQMIPFLSFKTILESFVRDALHVSYRSAPLKILLMSHYYKK